MVNGIEFEDVVTENFPMTKADWECILDYLMRELTLEALIALRNTLILLRALVEAYALLVLTPDIDKAIEKAIIDSGAMQAIMKVVNEVNQAKNSLMKFMPGDRLVQCTAFYNMLNLLDRSSGILLGSFAIIANYLSRYSIMSGIEGYRDLIIVQLLSYIDAMISCVDAAISYWGTNKWWHKNGG